MPFAAIYVPDFPVEAVVRANPELRERAVAVVEGTPPLLNVVAVNERARAAGVEAGMTELEALGRCGAGALARGSALEIRRRSAAQETVAHAALLDCACAFSPRVEDTAADTVLLDVTGLERLFGPAAKIARDLARHASEVGLAANVAVAANADTAIHAARGFAGVTIIPPGKEAERMGPLSVEVLSPPSEVLETLDRWGVRTCRALAALPAVAVAERLGTAGVQLQKLARGGGGRPLVPAEPPLKFEEAAEFDYPIEVLEPLLFILNRMLEQLCARLGARALSTRELRLRMEYENPPQRHSDTEKNVTRFPLPVSRPDGISARNAGREMGNEVLLRLPVPMLDAKVFLKLLQLELQAKPPQAPVSKVFLAAEPVQPRFAQGGLFLPTAPEPEKLELTLARIKAVISRQPPVAPLGNDSVAPGQIAGNGKRETGNDDFRVGSPELLDTHRADAFRMRRFVPPGSADVAPGSCPADPIASMINPVTAVRMFRPPVRIQVEVRDEQPVRVSAAPPGLSSGTHAVPGLTPWADTNATPSRLDSANTAGAGLRADDVLWASGPWRTSGDWWRTDAWAREEWDVAVVCDDTTALYRIYREIETSEWFVEASYD